MGITIEKARPEDAAELLEYLKIVGSETDNLSFGAEGLPFALEEEQQYLTSLQGSTTSAMFIAKKDGKIIGTADFRGNTRDRLKHRGEMGISLVKAEWGKGVGKKLMESVIEFAKTEAQAEIISLEVRSDNIRAIKLYEKYGFEKIGHFEGYMKVDGQLVACDFMKLSLF